MSSRYRKIINPKTGIYVLKNGSIGKHIKHSHKYCAHLHSPCKFSLRSRCRYKPSSKRKSHSKKRRSKSRSHFKHRFSPRQLSKHNKNYRPSPSESATLFPKGTIKNGNNGNLWKIKQVTNGVKRWVPF